jgi:hypothetical protein
MASAPEVEGGGEAQLREKALVEGGDLGDEAVLHAQTSNL